MLARFINRVNDILLSKSNKLRFERFIFIFAIVAFIIHFSLASLVYFGVIPQGLYGYSDSIPSPISTIYTPFTIILIYEIYLLIYYLPKSITNYLGKQYEIIALILVRGIFDSLASLTSESSFNAPHITTLLYQFVGFLILLLLIFCFYKLSENKNPKVECTPQELKRRESFILKKKVLALALFIVFILLFISSFLELRNIHHFEISDIVYIIKKMNASFFDTFFTALILTEVLLLLFTYNLSREFNKVIRNSGFIISTILLKLSFKTEGVSNLLIVLIAVAFGVAILGIYRLFENRLHQQD